MAPNSMTDIICINIFCSKRTRLKYEMKRRPPFFFSTDATIINYIHFLLL